MHRLPHRKKATLLAATLLWAGEGMALSPIPSDRVAMNNGYLIGRLDVCGISQDVLMASIKHTNLLIHQKVRNENELTQSNKKFEEYRKRAQNDKNPYLTCEQAKERFGILRKEMEETTSNESQK